MLHPRDNLLLVLQSCLVCSIALIVALAVYSPVGGGGLVTLCIRALGQSLGNGLLVTTLVGHGARRMILVRDCNVTAVRPRFRFCHTVLNDGYSAVTPLLTAPLLHLLDRKSVV